MRRRSGRMAFGAGAVGLLTASALTAQATPAALQWQDVPVNQASVMIDDVDATWAVGATGESEQKAVVLRLDAGRWKPVAHPVKTNASLHAVAVGGPKNVWAVGDDNSVAGQPKPLVLRFDGTRWKVVPAPAVPTGSLSSVAIGPDGVPWVSGWAEVAGREHATAYRFVGGKWQPLIKGLEGSINGNTLAVVGPNDAWLGLNAGLARFDGKAWKLVADLPTDGSKIPTGLAVAGPKDIWLVGVDHTARERRLAMHYDGARWTNVPVPAGWAQLYDVALHNNRPVAVGEHFIDEGDYTRNQPDVLTYNGKAFVAAPAPKTPLGVLTGVTVTNNQLLTVGTAQDDFTTPYKGLSAITR
ncbi:hypothetical protein HPO96_31645 [Kribbella sandramycini]|uniref:Uncharacterized protein n=1 Tax=Kribbella sandramycini TaxID=60450 RepID=A0A7Y4L5M0_9ACTN|nr:hypothetical protein [Kribbella sandramycini]MBB6567097.1 hypothetical protein [Kribbella sandramycini]NOL44815.1 hypothetical protein [Kribbella sandramycini]